MQLPQKLGRTFPCRPPARASSLGERSCGTSEITRFWGLHAHRPELNVTTTTIPCRCVGLTHFYAIMILHRQQKDAPPSSRGSADGGAAGELLPKGDWGRTPGNTEMIYCAR